jgi:hypothetical protein
MASYFSEGMTEDDEVYGKIAREVMRSISRARKQQGGVDIATKLALSAAGPFMQAAYLLDPENKKDKKTLGWQQHKDILKQPDPDKYGTTLWRGGSWKQPLDPRFHVNPAEEPEYGGFPKVFKQLDSGAYGYGWPTSVEEHPRFRGTIPGTDIPYGPPKITSDADRAEVNVAYQEKRRWLLQMIRFWEGKNPIKAANYRTELENLSEDDF